MLIQSTPCRLIIVVAVVLALLALLSHSLAPRNKAGHPVTATNNAVRVTWSNGDAQLEDLASLERAIASGLPLDPKTKGSCAATLQWLQSSQSWCKSIEDLQSCTEQLHKGAAEHCTDALKGSGNGLAALRSIGGDLQAAVLAASSGESKTTFHCTAPGDQSQDILCEKSDIKSKCELESVGQGRHSFNLCRALLPKDGCMIYSFGAATGSEDKPIFEDTQCNSFSFNTDFKLPFSFKGRSAFFKASAPMPDRCVGSDCSAKPSSTSPATVRKLSGHKRVSILALNCGGCEYQLAQDVLVTNPVFFSVVDQVSVEVHLDQRMGSATDATQLGLLFVLLAQAGLHLVHVRIRKCALSPTGACPEHLKAAGGFCDESRRCQGLLFARLRSESTGSLDATAVSAARDAPNTGYPRWMSSDMLETASRETFFATACASHDAGGYGKLQLLWSLEEQKSLCGGCMLLGNVFVSDRDWQKRSGYGSAESEGVTGKYTDCAKTQSCTPLTVSFDTLKMYYDSVKESQCCCTLLHDGAFDTDFIDKYETERIRFLKVDVLRLNTIFNRKFGLNDARYFTMHEAFCAHKGWQKVFFSDIFDVKIGKSPCKDARHGMLYIGTDNAVFQSTWLRRRFSELGSRYLEFFEKNLWKEDKRPMWSAGIVGAGDRETMLEFLTKLLAVLTDPEIEAVKRGDYQGVNMAAVTFVAEQYFKGRTSGGPPLNSKYRSYERKRRDVWFIHK